MKLWIAKTVTVLSISLCLAGIHSQTAKGGTITADKSTAKTHHLYELGLNLHTLVSSRRKHIPEKIRSQTSVQYALNTKVGFPILKNEVSTFQKNQHRIGHTELALKSAAPGYADQALALKTQLIPLLTINNPDRLSLQRIVTLTDQYHRLLAVAHAGGAHVDNILDIDEVTYLSKLAAQTPVATSNSAVRDILQQKLKLKTLPDIHLYPPLNNNQVDSMGAELFDLLKTSFELTQDYSSARYFLRGHYISLNKGTILHYRLLDQYQNTVDSASITLDRKLQPKKSSDTPLLNLSRQLNRGLVLVRDDNIESLKEPFSALSKPLNISVRTESGNEALFYRIGDQGKLFVKLSEHGYFYIIGHINKGNKHYSYLLPLTNKQGKEKFIRRVREQDSARWLELGTFDILPPTGSESLQIIASTENPAHLIPHYQFNPGLKVYFINDQPQQVVQRVRGLVKIAIDEAARKQKISPSADNPQQIPGYAEAVLEFSTLEKSH